MKILDFFISMEDERAIKILYKIVKIYKNVRFCAVEVYDVKHNTTWIIKLPINCFKKNCNISPTMLKTLYPEIWQSYKRLSKRYTHKIAKNPNIID